MAKIYNLLVHQVCDNSDIRLDVTTYTDYDKARKDFDNIVSDETQYAKKKDWIFDNYNDDYNFCAFEQDNFCANNTVIQLIEHEI